jgi:HSP20 family protein
MSDIKISSGRKPATSRRTAPTHDAQPPRETRESRQFLIAQLFEAENARSATAGHGPEQWSPAIDVYLTDLALVIAADLPGVERENILLSITHSGLIIDGERLDHVDEFYCRRERPTGRFRRTLPLPKGADPDGVRATFADGVLEIVIPMSEMGPV